MEFFTARKMTASTTLIRDITGVYSYLVTGTHKAVLIDTCTGTGDLKQYAETLTELPISVILTHGHCDHAGGAAPFEEVYLNEADWELAASHASIEMRKDYVRFCCPDIYAKLGDEDFCPIRTTGYQPLENGQIFDLGGVTLEAVAVPGHTRGMTCLLHTEERWILFGDGCNPALFIWDQEATSVEEYRESLLELKKYENRYDTVYLSHGNAEIDKKILDGTIEVCNDVMNRQADDQPFPFMQYTLKLAKATDARGNRLDGGLGNLVYNPERIFK